MKEKEWYQRTKEDTLTRLRARREGLSSQEADKRLREVGENRLKEGKKKSAFRVFLEQFADLLVVILIIAAVISLASGNLESTVVILVVLVLNAVLGTVQHVKAEKSLESLKSLSSPNAKVIRDGQKVELPSRTVVPGDVVVLEAGDLVVADGRILDNYSLQVNESSLTGESTNVDKADRDLEGELPLADRVNMVYSGSLVTYGRALVVVTGTGMDTEIGKIADLMNAAKEKRTPLQVSLDQFSRRLAALILVVCALVLGLSLYRGMALMDALLFAVALAVAAIPEALGSIVTIVQAMGTQKMAKENAIIKNLAAVESLGCVSVICSDKTGTLTQNKMTVQKLYVGEEILTAGDLDLRIPLHRYLLYTAVLANDSSIVDGKGIGDPTEYALLELYHQVQGIWQREGPSLHENDLRQALGRIDEVPFDSERKLMSTRNILHGIPTVLTKGAVDVLLERCVDIATRGGVRAMTQEERQAILAQNQAFSQGGLRVLAFAFKESRETLSPESEYGYTFLGLISMMDPPRPESVAAVADAKRAGIRPVMITGDHKVTATAIARQIGIFQPGDLAMTGLELDAISDEELDEKIAQISVYARVSPENKIRIVDAWQRRGNIVSMTGDGVNDAPALKKADIGVAMGITGTEVAKDAASMILADDNFATIIKAVANGRNVYRNIRNAILFLLSGNMAGILAVLYTSLMALPVPFAPVQLLFINLVTDSLPALAIGMEPALRDLLGQKPRDPKRGILTRDFMLLILGQGALIAASTLVAFYLGLTVNTAVATTMAFSTLTLARLFHGFNCRGKHSIFTLGFEGNWYSLGAFLLGAALLAVVLSVPAMESAFSVAALTAVQAGRIILLAVLPTLVIQAIKVVAERLPGREET